MVREGLNLPFILTQTFSHTSDEMLQSILSIPLL